MSAAPRPRVHGRHGAERRRDPEAPTGSPTTVHREPLVDADGVVRGYGVRVTVRAPLAVVPLGPARDALVHDRFDTLDLSSVVEGGVAFVRATAGMLLGHHDLPRSRGGLVLEVPAAFVRRPDAATHLAALRARGVGVTLVDYLPDGPQDALLGLADFVTVDLGHGADASARAIRRAHRSGMAVIAERVLSRAAERFCVEHSVDLTAGARRPGLPVAPGVRRMPVAPGVPDPPDDPAGGMAAGQVQCLELIHLLSGGPVDDADAIRIVATDPVLAVAVLRAANLHGAPEGRHTDSVAAAVALLGHARLAALVTACLLGARTSSPVTLHLALTRALACRTLAHHDGAYTVGLLSALPATTAVSPAHLVGRAGVTARVRDAVCDGAGPWGHVITAVLAHEVGDPRGVAGTGLDADLVADVYLAAAAEAFATATSLGGAG